MIEIHQQVNVLLSKERMIINLLMCIRNAVKDSTLEIKSGTTNTRGKNGFTINLPIPRIRSMQKKPFYWGYDMYAFKSYVKSAVMKQ